MRLKLFAACLSILIAAAASAAFEKREAFTLGSLHGYMLEHPQYTLREFMAALELYQPDLILTETRRAFPGSAEGAIDGGIEQGIVYAFGSLHGIPVEAVDWFDDSFINAQLAEFERYAAAPIPELEDISSRYGAHFESDSLIELHSTALQSLVREQYRVMIANGYTAAEKRNERICQNIRVVIDGSRAKRVLVVFGLDHKYYQDDCLRGSGMNVLEIGDWLDSGRLQAQPLNPALLTQSMANIEESQQLLDARIKNGYYSPALAERLAQKLGSFPRWLAKLAELKGR